MLMSKDNARAGDTLSRSLGTLTAYWLLLITFELALSASEATFLVKECRWDDEGGSTYHPVRERILKNGSV